MTESRKIYNSIRALKRPELIPQSLRVTAKRNFWKWYGKNCAFPMPNAISFSGLDDLAAMEAGSSFPINSSKLGTQPPYEESGVYKIHTDCECEWLTSYFGKKHHRENISIPIVKIVEKSAISGIKLLEENYCQSAQKECKLLVECDWHKSPYAIEYYGQTVTELSDIVPSKLKQTFADFRNEQTQVLTINNIVNIQEQPEKKSDRKSSVQTIKADLEEVLDELQMQNKENFSNFLQLKPQPRKPSDGIHWKILDHNSDMQTKLERKEFFDFLRLKRKENPECSLSQPKEEEYKRQSDDDQVLLKIEPNIEVRKKSKKKKKTQILHNSL